MSEADSWRKRCLVLSAEFKPVHQAFRTGGLSPILYEISEVYTCALCIAKIHTSGHLNCIHVQYMFLNER